jgi:CdiI immunity protein
MEKNFQYLDSLIGGSFHQDWDPSGETTIEEVITSFKERVSAEGVRLALADIKEYLAEHPDDAELEQHFYKTFDPDIIQGMFGTAREFITKLADLLSAPETPLPSQRGAESPV